MAKVTINKYKEEYLFWHHWLYIAETTTIKKEGDRFGIIHFGSGKTEEIAIQKLKEAVKKHKEAEYPKEIEVDFND